MKTNSVEEQFGIRLFRREGDVAGFVRLRAEIEAFDQAGNDISQAAAISTLNWPGHDPERDRWVVEMPGEAGRLVGHAWARAQSPERTIVYAAIHPDWRRKGLGGALLERAIARAVEAGATHVTAGADVKNKGAEAFLLRQGFRHAGDNRFLRLPAGAPLAEAAWPAGYTLRSYAQVQNLSTLVEAFNRSYGDLWGHRENTPGAMNEAHLAENMRKYPEWYNPEGIFIAFAPDGGVAGVCLGVLGPESAGQDEERGKTVDSPGVTPEHRHLGLQRQLTLTAAHWLRSYGPGPIHLETYGDSLQAFEIYQELGFLLEEHYVEYCKYLRNEN